MYRLSKGHTKFSEIIKAFEKGFALLVIFLISGAIGPFIGDENQLFVVKQCFAYSGCFISILLILLRWQKASLLISSERLLWILVVLAAASPIWSSDPALTYKLVLPLIRVTIFGIYLAVSFSLEEIIELTAFALGFAALMSVMVAVAVPRYGVVGAGLIVGQEEIVHVGAWRGVYVHKTMLGTAMAIGIMSSTFVAVKLQKYKWLMWINVFLSFFVLIRSTTKAALGILIFSFLVFQILRLLQINLRIILPISLIIALVLVLSGITLWIYFDQTALAQLGNEITLTGRTEIWPPLINEIFQQPWFGYGYLTYWEEGWKGDAAKVWRELIPGFEPPHAHNGLLEVWLELGSVGLIIFLSLFARIYLQSLYFARSIKRATGTVPVMFFTLLILFNVTESYLMRPDLFWLIFVALTLILSSTRLLEKPMELGEKG